MSAAEGAGASLRYFASARARALGPYWVCALPFVATLARFRNAFVFDDVFIIRSDFIFDLANLPRALVNRAMIASSLDKVVGRPGMDTYRPLSIASFFWDAALSGRTPWSYHLSNAILHCIACALLLALLNRLLPALAARYRTCLVAWFGLSPWLAEAHVWINGRSDLLLAIGFLLALLAMRRALQEQRLALAWVSALCLFAGMLSKEIAVLMLPFVAAVPLSHAISLRTRLRYAWPLGIALALYLLLRSYSLSGLRTHSDSSQLALAIKQLPFVLLDGAQHILVLGPYFLRSMRDDYAALPGFFLPLAWLLFALLVALLLRYVHRAYTLVWSVACALAALAPAAMISTSLWPGFGRYLYVPALAFTVALGAALGAAPSLPRFALPALAAYSALAGLLLVDATLGFVDEETLYARAIAERPLQAWTHGMMGMALRREARCPEAIAFLNRAATMDPSEARYAIRLAQCLLETGAVEAAQQVAEAGRSRFAGTRSEPGFLIVAARALPVFRAAEQAALLKRCLMVDPERTDCQMLLDVVQNGSRSTTVESEPN